MKKLNHEKRTFPGPYPEPHTVDGTGSGKLPPDGDAQPEHDGGNPPLMTSHPIGASYPDGQDLGPYTDHKGEGLYHSFALDFTNEIPYNSGGVHPHTGLMLFALALNMRAEIIVETGTCFGTSTLYLAKACEVWGAGKVYTIDPNPKRCHPSLHDNPYIEVITGMSEQVLPELTERLGQIDFAFIDSWKRLAYVEFCLVADCIPGGGIAAFHDTQFLNTGRTFHESVQHLQRSGEWEQMLFAGTPHVDNPHCYFGNADDRGLCVMRRTEDEDVFLDVRDSQSDRYGSSQIQHERR